MGSNEGELGILYVDQELRLEEGVDRKPRGNLKWHQFILGIVDGGCRINVTPSYGMLMRFASQLVQPRAKNDGNGSEWKDIACEKNSPYLQVLCHYETRIFIIWEPFEGTFVEPTYYSFMDHNTKFSASNLKVTLRLTVASASDYFKTMDSKQRMASKINSSLSFDNGKMILKYKLPVVLNGGQVKKKSGPRLDPNETLRYKIWQS